MLSVLDACIAALAWAEAHDYRGYGKGDALNSPLLRALAGDSRLLRSGFVYLVSRSPVNLRPMLGVEKRESPKALALLARTYLNLHGLTGERVWMGKATDLLDRLLKLSRVEVYSRHCWGAEYPRSNPRLGADSYHPGAVITCEVAEAFLDAVLEFLHTKGNEAILDRNGFVKNEDPTRQAVVYARRASEEH